METPHGSSGFTVLLLLLLLLLKGGSSAPISISRGGDGDGERRSLGETGSGSLPSLPPLKDHPLYVEHSFAISGSRHSARLESLKRKVAALRRRDDDDRDRRHALHVIEGVNGDGLALLSDEGDQLHFRDSASGLSVRLWDWREGRGVGGAGMDTRTVARIAACSMSHILASAKALHYFRQQQQDDDEEDVDNDDKRRRKYVLVLEDDVTFRPLLEEPGGLVAVREAVEAAEHLAATEGEGGGASSSNDKSRNRSSTSTSTSTSVGLIQFGYLIPSPRVAVAGIDRLLPLLPPLHNRSLLVDERQRQRQGQGQGQAQVQEVQEGQGRHSSDPLAVRRRRACGGDDRRVVGVQAYLLAAEGAAAVLDAHWRPGGAEGAVRWWQEQQQKRQMTTMEESSPSPAAASSWIDLRPAVNFAADYMLFSAIEATSSSSSVLSSSLTQRSKVRSYISFRPWIVEDEALSAASSLFPGTVKQATADTLRLSELLLDGRQPPQRPPKSTPVSLASSNLSRRKIDKLADFMLVGDDLIDVSSGAATPRDMLRLLLPPTTDEEQRGRPETIFEAAVAQCFHVCEDDDDAELEDDNAGTVTILVPSAMQCWRATVPLRPPPAANAFLDCVAAGLDTDPGTCEMLQGAIRNARRIKTWEQREHSNEEEEELIDKQKTADQEDDEDPFVAIAKAVRSLHSSSADDPTEGRGGATSGSSSRALKKLEDAYGRLGDRRTAEILQEIAAANEIEAAALRTSSSSSSSSLPVYPARGTSHLQLTCPMASGSQECRARGLVR